MAKPQETLDTEKRTVVCDGGDGPLGHPRVFLQIGNDDKVECPYCGRLYIYRKRIPLDAVG